MTQELMRTAYVMTQKYGSINIWHLRPMLSLLDQLTLPKNWNAFKNSYIIDILKIYTDRVMTKVTS